MFAPEYFFKPISRTSRLVCIRARESLAVTSKGTEGREMEAVYSKFKVKGHRLT